MKSIRALAAAGTVVFAAGGVAGGFAIHEKAGDSVTVSHDGKPVVKLVTRNDTATKEAAFETYKVFLHVMDPTDPRGKRMLTKGPGDKFPHHRGIFIGWSKALIDGRRYDTWHMKNGMRQEFDRVINRQDGTFTAAINWVSGDELLLSEERKFRVHEPEANGAFLLDVTSRITAVKGDTELNGDPEHAGCQFRAAAEVVGNKSANYLFPGGNMTQKEVQSARNLPWAAMNFKVGGREYHVQHMSHPSLPKPVRYSAYRDYGRFGSFFVTKVKRGEAAEFKVRFYISPGAFPAAMIADSQHRYRAYADDD